MTLSAVIGLAWTEQLCSMILPMPARTHDLEQILGRKEPDIGHGSG